MLDDLSPWVRQHPRPQFRRKSFYVLRGPWELNGQSIEVPFPPESPLAAFEGQLPADGQLHYTTAFSLPAGFIEVPGSRVLLHFGAVDAVCAVFVNGRPAVRHEGGYLPFSADITDLLVPGENRLDVCAEDTLNNFYPYGKQCRKPHGMWYTPVSGIWQPVWLEAVPPHAVQSLKITPDLTGIALSVETDAPSYTVAVRDGTAQAVRRFTGRDIRLEPAELGLSTHLWTPEDPYLYELTVQTDTDTVYSYFALRTVTIQDARICLNGEPVFLLGVLDQGYFEDGIFLPERPEAYDQDILRMKELGFNTLRKHIKVEPDYFYAACDRLGMLVLQDMVNNGGYNFILDTALPSKGFQKRPDHLPGGTKRKAFFIRHAAETQAHLYNHPCVVGYTIFNEGWGQFDADENYARCKAADPTRFYDATSGWFAQKHSDLESPHIYFRNEVIAASQGRPLFLSECGGYARPVPGHLYRADKSYGYGTEETEEALTARIELMFREMVFPSIPGGLCGCIYTQISDVETEINGLYTYDRAVCKVDKARILALSRKTYADFAKAARKQPTAEAAPGKG